MLMKWSNVCLDLPRICSYDYLILLLQDRLNADENLGRDLRWTTISIKKCIRKNMHGISNKDMDLTKHTLPLRIITSSSPLTSSISSSSSVIFISILSVPNSLTLLAYRRVLRVCSHDWKPGEIIAIYKSNDDEKKMNQ
ncbi:hypothetical protein BLOT_001643 [Blomia tropicalis]|nr:hypothetical protein BLOT_001643 [Blomia tropicalis]